MPDQEIELFVQELARLRDELELQLHLGRAEAKAQWEQLEKKWTLMQSRLSVLRVAGKESMHDLRDALKQLLAELKDGYDRMREALARV